MDIVTVEVGLLALAVGIAIGTTIGWPLLRHRRASRLLDRNEAVVREEVSWVLSAFPIPALLIEPETKRVVWSSPSVESQSDLMTAALLKEPSVQAMMATAMEKGTVTGRDVSLLRPIAQVRVRVGNLSGYLVLLFEDLSEAYRVEAVRRDFVANVSHELKTPVGALSLLSEAVHAASDDPEAVAHFADRMQEESARLNALVADLLDLSKLQSDESVSEGKPVPIDHVIEEAVGAVRLMAQSQSIDLQSGGQSGLTVFGSDSQLVTALRNLLSNAIHYSPAHTRVGVGTALDGDRVEIIVTDQGVGIPEKDLERIFERFYRIDPARSRATGGTGLGLSIVKHICHNHGGEVSVWSVEGEGSTFTLSLPLYRSESDAGAAPESASAGGAS